MRKILCVLISVLMLCGSIAACSTAGAAEDGNISIVATIFPEYDWVMNVLGDKASCADVTMLLDSVVDLHSYQPTAADIVRISNCDLFIYVGGESDAWVEDVLADAVNKDMKVINLLDVLGSAVKEEEIVEGMQGGDEECEEEIEYDEHVWLSLNNASVIVDAISEALSAIDPDNADSYSANAASYKEQLSSLDGRYRSMISGASSDTLIFGDRFPFRYLTDDYGLEYYAAFAGCSAETEASFETIMFLAGKMDELGLHAIMTIEGPDKSIAETIISNTSSGDQAILTLDSMQSVTSEDVSNGVTYLSVMEDNLAVLTEALN